ncbi:unannotated protein [freshwater metagenome]|uniref:Unannotated protein n=1 Tax=freshwater metagenome TaxID=449393 RepID=A0A6J7VUE0_9ZZZZ
MRLKKPREAAAIRAIDAKVIMPTAGLAAKLFFAAPARLRPITMTIVPVTIGGNIQLIQPIPAWRTMSPTAAKIRPVTTTPPRAADIPPPDFAAAIGARNAKDDPR